MLETGFRRRIGDLLRRLGVIKEHRLSMRYPRHRFGSGTYGNLLVREWGNDGLLSVGSYTSIAPGVAVLLGGEHRPDWVTTFPFSEFISEFSDIPGHPKSKGDVEIGSDVWIGTDALILSGVKIGHGAVIGARSLVTRDVPPYAFVAGNPAKFVRFRFEDETIKKLLGIRWWDWPLEKIKRAVPDMLSGDIERFIMNTEAGEYN